MMVQRFAIATTVATFILLLVGGTVNPTGSSLACPDWPTCYGSFFPEMKNGVQYEHSHRLVATLVGLMSIILAVWIWRARRTDRRAVALGFGALGLVIVQGVLGGLTVLLKLPLFVSVAHLALSMLFFVLMIFLCFRLDSRPTSGAEREPPPKENRSALIPRGIILLAGVAVYLQILLGALVRHTKSGRVCNQDFLLCAGELWPNFGPAQLHMTHRFFGLIVFAVVLLAAIIAARRAREFHRPLSRLGALAAPWLITLQIALGILTVTSSIGLFEAVAHLGVGAILLGDLAFLFFSLGPLHHRSSVSAGSRASSSLAAGSEGRA